MRFIKRLLNYQRKLGGFFRYPLQHDPNLIQHLNKADIQRESFLFYLYRIRKDPAYTLMTHGYASNIPLCLFSDPYNWFQSLWNTSKRYRNHLQRPSHYFPHLRASPWHPYDETANILERNFTIIRNEFYMVEEYLKTHHQTYLTGKGDWKIFSLTRGKYRYKQNCGLCPETTKIIDSLPICWDGGGNIFFSVIQPGTHLNPHCGHTNTRIRYHLGIETSGSGKIRVGTESRTWQNGKCFVFDDSFIHEVYHNSSDRRVVLIVDCWHPDLTEAEKIFLLNMFIRLRTFED